MYDCRSGLLLDLRTRVCDQAGGAPSSGQAGGELLVFCASCCVSSHVAAHVRLRAALSAAPAADVRGGAGTQRAALPESAPRRFFFRLSLSFVRGRASLSFMPCFATGAARRCRCSRHRGPPRRCAARRPRAAAAARAVVMRIPSEWLRGGEVLPRHTRYRLLVLAPARRATRRRPSPPPARPRGSYDSVTPRCETKQS